MRPLLVRKRLQLYDIGRNIMRMFVHKVRGADVHLPAFPARCSIARLYMARMWPILAARLKKYSACA